MVSCRTSNEPAVETAWAAFSALGLNTGDPAAAVAELCVDGARCYASALLDTSEVDRRQRLGHGAATDLGLLHALWDLPEDVPISWRALADQDKVTLRNLGSGWVDIDEAAGTVTRTYRPAGRVRALASLVERLPEAIQALSQYPRIFWRIAVLPGGVVNCEDLGVAVDAGVGVLLMREGSAEMVLTPPVPRLGVPHIYRWWISELVYRNWTHIQAATADS